MTLREILKRLDLDTKFVAHNGVPRMDVPVETRYVDILKAEIDHQRRLLEAKGKRPVRVYLKTRDWCEMMTEVLACGYYRGLELVADDFFQTPRVAAGAYVR